MLKHPLIQPQILQSLAAAGHGSTVLIADGHYPLSTGTHHRSDRVFLNLTPGIPLVTDVLETLLTAVSVEGARVMTPGNGNEPAIFSEFQELLGSGTELQKLERFAFYDMARSEDLALAIATGETRVYANILLTIGVVSHGNNGKYAP